MIRIFFTACLFFTLNHLNAQIPDADFESWKMSDQGTYEEPSSGWWVTLNPLSNLGCPVSVEKTSDAKSGSFAARLTTVEWGTFTIPGLLVSGAFDFNLGVDAILQGQPFNQLPLKFSGYYKYQPAGNDSAVLYAGISRFNTSTNEREMIAEAAIAPDFETTSYAYFEIEFDYFLHDVEPDSITVIFSSSFDADNPSATPGSVLYVDDIAIETGVGIFRPLTPQHNFEFFPNPAHDVVTFHNTSEMIFSGYEIFDYMGRLVSMQQNITVKNRKFDIDISDLHSGIYFIVFTDLNGHQFTDKIVKQ